MNLRLSILLSLLSLLSLLCVLPTPYIFHLQEDTVVKLGGSHFVEKQNLIQITLQKKIVRLLVKTLKLLRLPKYFATDLMN